MGRGPDGPLTTGVASEVCQRQGVKAMLSGSISRLGNSYVITLDALNRQTEDFALAYAELGTVCSNLAELRRGIS